MKKNALFLSSFFFVGLAQAASYTYTFRGYPVAEGINCHQAAIALGEKWAQASGTSVLVSRCESMESSGAVVSIRYEAAEPVKPVSTIAPQSSPTAPRGIFKTKKDCEANLTEESRYFESATGLAAAIQYCFYDSLDKKTPYAVRIFGFGNPRVIPWFESGLIFGQAQGYTEQTFTEKVKANLKQLGVDVRAVAYHPNFGYGDLTVFHYSDKQQRLLVSEVVKVRTKEDCFNSLKEMDGFLNGTDLAPLMSYCAYQHVGAKYEITLLNWDKEVLQVNHSVESFDKKETCEAQRPGLIDYYRITLKRPVVGALCSVRDASVYPYDASTMKWELSLFEERR